MQVAQEVADLCAPIGDAVLVHGKRGAPNELLQAERLGQLHEHIVLLPGEKSVRNGR